MLRIHESAADELADLLPQIIAQMERDAKDGARYRWLRDPSVPVASVIDRQTEWVPLDAATGTGGHWLYEYRAGNELDTAIDRAIDAAKGKA